MRSTTGAFFRYSKGATPTDPKDLIVFLESELLNIQTALNELADGYMEFITVAPTKPRDGMLRNADAGVLGAAKGTYCYRDATWAYLG